MDKTESTVGGSFFMGTVLRLAGRVSYVPTLNSSECSKGFLVAYVAFFEWEAPLQGN